MRRTLVIGGSAATALVIAVVVLNVWMVRSMDGYRYVDVEGVPERPVAVVLGAGVFGNEPSPTLATRLDGAIELLRAGKVDHLLMTGDNSRPDYDEVTAMRDYAIRRGVPGDAITRDYAGFDTYDSCIRARDVFGVRAAVVVTQDFHLAREVFTCRSVGIDAVGLAVPDWAFRSERLPYPYRRNQEVGYTVREWLARVKAVLDTEVVQPGPTFGGPYEGLTET
jgi:vancomycin permeability regulator SanA